MRLQDRKPDCLRIVYGGILVLLYMIFVFLFYRQSIRYNGGYLSDTAIYVGLSKDEHGVRLITWIFNILYQAADGTILIALYMGLVVVGIILMNYHLIRQYLKFDNITASEVLIMLSSVAMLYTGSMYVPIIHEHFYKSSWCTFPWHSPTQHLMMLFGLISLTLFLKIYNNYMQRINPVHWGLLALSGVISVWAKPSFMLVFIPTMIIVFVIELITHREDMARRFGRLVIYGMSLVPAGILILILNSSIYGEGSENTVNASASHVMNAGYNVPVAALCGLMFPLIVCICNYRRFKEMKFQVALGMLAFGILEWMIFFEEGTRGAHGNFAWGRQAGCYCIFLCSMILAIENYKNKDFLGGSRKWRVLYFAALVCSIGLALVTQAYHFYMMLRGHSYYF